MSPSEAAPDKVAVYIRWSTDDQGEGTTLAVQAERCQHFLASQGWVYRPDLLYVDEGWSGGTLDRPALRRLRDDVDRGLVHCVVVYKIDRLSRSVVDIVQLVLREWDGRCFVKSTTEDVNTLTPAGKVFFYILVSFAEYERSVIRERTMGGKIKRAEQGLNPGFRPPYGLTRGPSPGTFAVVEHEANVVRRLFDLYRLGYGAHQIARMLDTAQPLHRGRVWAPLTVRRMLANPAYAGILAYGRTVRTGRKPAVQRLATPRYCEVPGALPPIVAEGLWKEVQERLQAGRRRRSPPRAEAALAATGAFLLAGLAVCRCGAPVHGKRVGRYRYYYCSARKRRGQTACAAGHVQAEPAEAALERQVRDVLSAALDGAMWQKAMCAALERETREATAGLAQARSEREALTERTRRLERDYRSGGLPADLYTSELAALEQASQGLEHRMTALAVRLEQCSAVLPEIAGSPAPGEAWDELAGVERQELLNKLAVSVEVFRQAGTPDPPEMRVQWVRL